MAAENWICPANQATSVNNVINQRTGEVIAGEIVKAGGKIKLPGTAVVWLIKEN
jgi:hypothetical protein